MTPAEQKRAAKYFVARWESLPCVEEEHSRSFWIELLQDVLGVQNATHALEFERKVKGRKIDVFYEDMGILIEMKGRGISLDEATVRSKKAGPETPYQQAKWYADNLPNSIRPRWIITCNFDEFRIYDMEAADDQYVSLALEELPEQVHLLSFFSDRCNSRLVKEKELSGSIACDGFVSSLSACFGCLPITSFSQNVGLVAMTKVVNRKAIATGAVIMILAAFLPVISVIFASLPEAVLGGCTIMMFGNIIVSGFQMIARAGFSQRNILIAALSLAVGIGFTQVSALFANFPELIQSVFAQNCVAVVFLVAVVANLVLPKDAGIEGATAMSERSTAEAAPSVDEDGDLATA